MIKVAEKSVVKKVAMGIVIVCVTLVLLLLEIVQGFIEGATVIGGALSGNPADVTTLSLMIAQEFSPQPIAGYACIDPDSLESGQKGSAQSGSSWTDAIVFDGNNNNQLVAALLTGGYLSSDGQANLVTADGKYGVYGLISPGSGRNYGISVEDALDPALATNFVVPRFSNAMNVVDPKLWSSNPSKAASAVAYAALQPDKQFTDNEIKTAWGKTEEQLKKLNISGNLTAPPVSMAPEVAAILGKNEQLFQAIREATGNDPNLQLALIMAPGIEDSWNNEASNADGAYGMYRIQHPVGAPLPGPPVHTDITVQDAMDPVLAMKYMLPTFKAAIDPNNHNRKVDFPSTLWTSNPKLAAEYTIFNAERPAELYHLTQGQGRVDDVYNKSLQIMQANGSSTQFIDEQCVSALEPSAQIDLNSGPVGFERSVVIKTASGLLGTPYSWGGGHGAYGPTYGICAGGAAWNDCHIAGVDCSGLTRYAFHAVNVDIGGTAADQWHKTKQWQEPMDKAQPGDLLFWTGSDGSYADPGHVAIYVGGGKAVMAPQSGDVVKIADITTPFWQNSFVGATDPYQQ